VREESGVDRSAANFEGESAAADAPTRELDYAIFTLDPLGRITSWNSGAERISGYSQQQAVGRHFSILYTDEDRARRLPAHALAVASARDAYRQEGWRVRRDGSRFRADSTITATRDADGELIGFAKVIRDLTERLRAEDSLRRSEESFRRLVFLAEAGRVLAASLDYTETLHNVAHLAVPEFADWCVVDVVEHGHIRRLSVAHADPDKEKSAWELVRRYPPRADAATGVAEAIRSGRPALAEVSDEMLRASSENEEHYELIRQLGLQAFIIAPMIARDRTVGAITFIAAESGRSYAQKDLDFALDLASRAALAVDNATLLRHANESRQQAHRRAREEQALRRAAEALTASFSVEQVVREIAATALQATDSDGAFVKRIDLEADEVVVVATAGDAVVPTGSRSPYRGSYTDTVVQDKDPLLIADLREAKQPLYGTLSQACGDCSAMVVPLLDAGEAFGSLVLTRLPGRDSFRGEDALRARAFADLASLAFRRIHLLEESERRREELENAIDSRARLIRGFTHDLKNPLGAADGYLQLIQTGAIDGPDRVEQGVSRTRRAIRAALGLLDDLAELDRAEAGQIEVKPTSVDVRDVVTEMVDEYRAQADTRGLRLGIDVPDRLPLITSDPSRIRQVLGNLLSNAVKYTPSGSVQVRVARREGAGAPPGAAWVAIDIADTGPGIPADKLPLLFREFERLDPAAAPGAGLGLAISRRVAAALGGCVTVESERGHGSTFTLWLPERP
jgi:PAS domain S-box-containing protein